jgi:hypothetical protein
MMLFYRRINKGLIYLLGLSLVREFQKNAVFNNVLLLNQVARAHLSIQNPNEPSKSFEFKRP